ncbi:MAG: ABC transporter permease [Candidatus Limnocylindrales bacterium]
MTTAEERPARRQRRGRSAVYNYAVLIALVFLIAVFSLVAPTTFPTIGNVRAIVNSQGVLLILALGLTMPVISGDFDLSVGFNMGLAGTLVAALSGAWGWPDALAIVATLGVAALVGLANGWLIVYVGIDAFIATLASGTVLGGLTLFVSNGSILTTVPASLETFAQAKVPTLGIATPALAGFALALVLWYVYDHTPLGRWLYFVGEGREAARLTGLRVKPIRLAAFIGSGLVSGLAGLLLTGELGGMSPAVGPTFLLPAYAACFLGATTIKPGRVNAIGTVVGLYLLVVGVTGLELLGVESWVEQVFNGIALIVAVAFARLVSTEQLS